MRNLIKFFAVVGVIVGFTSAAQASTEVDVVNDSDHKLDVYYLAIGCIGMKDDLWVVCKKESLAPHSSTKYNFSWYTTKREVLTRPEAITQMLNNNFDMDPGWGNFAKSWVNAFKNVVQQGPKGLYSFKDTFDKLSQIWAKVDLSHELSKWNANLGEKYTLEFGNYDADNLIKKIELKLQKCGDQCK